MDLVDDDGHLLMVRGDKMDDQEEEKRQIDVGEEERKAENIVVDTEETEGDIQYAQLKADVGLLRLDLRLGEKNGGRGG